MIISNNGDDIVFFSRHYQITSAENGMTREETTEYNIRRHYSQLINGVCTFRYSVFNSL